MRFIRTAACLMSLLVGVNTAFADNQTRTNPESIHFDKGSIVADIEGQLASGVQEKWYAFDAQKGQYMVVNLKPKPGTPETANVGVLHYPSGKQDGSKGGIVYQDCLPESGTYTLRIARNLMATQGKTAGYRAEIVILPKFASKALCE